MINFRQMHGLAELISYYKILSGFIGVLGFGLATVCIVWLGKRILTRSQKILILLLGSLTFVFWIIFGLLNYGFENGPTFNLGLFQMDWGYSEGLAWLL